MNQERLETLRAYFASKWYILTVALLVILAHTTVFVDGRMLFCGYQEFIFGGLMLLLVSFGCFVCTDLRFMIMPFITFIFLVTLEHSPNVPDYSLFYIEPLPLILIIFLACVLFGSIGWFAVKNRKNANPISWKGSAFLGMAVFCGGLLINGFFSSQYTISDTLYPISFLLSLLGVYLLFALFIRFDESSMEYFMTCLLATGLIICAELLLAYATGGVRFDESGNLIKESVMLGWGVWTAIGGMLVFLMPVCFYFAHSHAHGWVYYLLGLLEYVCIFLSQSRGALLFGTAVLGLCVLVLFFDGKNRKCNRIITGVILLAGVLGVILLWNRLAGVLNNYLEYGFSDNGRYDKWRAGWSNFLKAPVFGSGFYTTFEYGDWEKAVYPYLYHNTLVQILSSCGVVGMAAYLYHRYCTVRLVFVKRNPMKLFLGIGILGLISFSLLDVLFFNTYPTIIYSLMLLFMEKSELFHGKDGAV